ncbi:hypothetical protein [Paraburkholderia tropica]|uniref:hypothetical protein n=1 Tax=Paraburkholderia tropica TaxID=92647 RepID=UPI002AB78145|nr:hypothetical protein [Paraburkholderia tropica]
MNASTLNEITDRSTRERPILFNGPMVRAILDGSKTQTRRVAKVRGELPPEWATFASEGHSLSQDSAPRPVGSFFWSEEQQPGQPLKSLRRWPILPKSHPMAGDWYWTPSPFGKVGDRLWVRETHEVNRIGFEESWTSGRTYHAGVKYQADDGRADFEITEGLYQDLSDTESRGWTPSIHMPRWASRITLKVTGVRVERLQAISDADAEAEGIDFLRHVPDADETLTPSQLFMCLWDSVATPGADWAANPWVWVVDFKRVSEAA